MDRKLGSLVLDLSNYEDGSRDNKRMKAEVRCYLMHLIAGRIIKLYYSRKRKEEQE